MNRAAPAVLVIAGTDSSGGAGLLRDVQTLVALNLVPRCAVTAVTAQTHAQVVEVARMSPRLVASQIDAAFASGPIAAVKIGMLGDASVVGAVAQSLQGHAALPIVLDPVILSSSGGELLSPDGIEALLTQLLPLSTLITPNLPELAHLTRTPLAQDELALTAQARQLLQWGARAVLVKGGHGQGAEAVDWLLTADDVVAWRAPRVAATRRGTGCMLATAIAGYLAQGLSLPDACQRAKQQVREYLLR